VLNAGNTAVTDGVPGPVLAFSSPHCRLTARARPQIRFTRLGRNKSPFFRVVVMDSRTRRDGRPLEVRPLLVSEAGLRA
jgi:Ribosomal protein S16